MSKKDLRLLEFKSRFSPISTEYRDVDDKEYIKNVKQDVKAKVSDIVKEKLILR